jgi:ribonuclease HII
MLGVQANDKIIIDGLVNYCPQEFTNVQTVAKADQLHPTVSAASIYAKVLRDAHMVRAAKFHPFYGFEKHVGYGTALHQNALKVHGISKIHRTSFKPIQAFL